MANPKKRRKIIIFAAIGAVLVALTLVAIFKKKQPVVTVQTEKVARHSLTNIVVANGKSSPSCRSPSAGGQREIIELPCQEGAAGQKGSAGENQPGNLPTRRSTRRRPITNPRSPPRLRGANLEKTRRTTPNWNCSTELLSNRISWFQGRRDVAKGNSTAPTTGERQALVDSAQDSLIKTTIVPRSRRHHQQLNSQLGERVLGRAFAGRKS